MAMTFTITVEPREGKTPNYTEIARKFDALLASEPGTVNDWSIATDVHGDWAWTEDGGKFIR